MYAIRSYYEAAQLLPEGRGHISALQAADIVFRLGVANMRMGETENCCNRFTHQARRELALAPEFFTRNLKMRNFNRQAGLLADADRLLDGGNA